MLFLVQLGNNGIPTTDLGYQLIQACEFQNWRAFKEVYAVLGIKPNGDIETIIDSTSIKVNPLTNEISLTPEAPEPTYLKYVPVGTIEFTERYLNRKIKPINIPSQLETKEFLKRKIYRVTIEEFLNRDGSKGLTDKAWYFVKSDESIKAIESDIYTVPEIIKINDKYKGQQLLFSEIIPGKIESEWRVFVYKGKIVGLRQYSGNEFGSLPSQATIQKMISKYTKAPRSYTLDVAVININNRKYTILIEVHNFVACGLYGFEEYNILPQMVAQGFAWELSREGNH